MSRTSRLAPANSARRAHHLIRRATVGSARRGNSAVHRNSSYAGETEQRAWRTHNIFSARERRARLEALREWNYAEKRPGECWGPLGPSGERVLDSLMGLRCFRTGRLDIAIRTMAAKFRMCVQTVVSYIARFEDLGLLVKLRRSRPIEDPEPGGPLVEQITNAYWFQLPAELAERVRQILGRGGKPACQAQREAEEAEQLAAALATLSSEEFVRFCAGETGLLADALASLARCVDVGKERDSNRSNVNPVEKDR